MAVLTIFSKMKHLRGKEYNLTTYYNKALHRISFNFLCSFVAFKTGNKSTEISLISSPKILIQQFKFNLMV